MTRVFYAIGALALAWFAMREISGHAAEDAKLAAAEQRADSSAIYADSVRLKAQSDSVRYAKEKEVWADSTGKLIARVDRAEERRPAMQAGVVARHVPAEDTTLTRIVAAAVAEAVDSVVANEVVPLRKARTMDLGLIARQQLELADDDYLIGQLYNALDTSREEARLRELAGQKKGGLFGIRISPELAFGGGVLATLVVMVALR